MEKSPAKTVIFLLTLNLLASIGSAADQGGVILNLSKVDRQAGIQLLASEGGRYSSQNAGMSVDNCVSKTAMKVWAQMFL